MLDDANNGLWALKVDLSRGPERASTMGEEAQLMIRLELDGSQPACCQKKEPPI